MHERSREDVGAGTWICESSFVEGPNFVRKPWKVWEKCRKMKDKKEQRKIEKKENSKNCRGGKTVE